MKVLIVTSMLFYYAAAIPYYQSIDYNSDTICLEAQNNGWSGRIPGCPPPPSTPSPAVNVYNPDCDTCSSNQGYNIQQENQAWGLYTKICVNRKNVCLRKCQWNVQCKTQCQMQFPCSYPPAMGSIGSNNA